MPYRRFTDSRGTLWRVWDVVPSRLDRRLASRRVRGAKIVHSDRRLHPTRRVDITQARLYFPQEEAGWLCFESDGVRHRLRPIPTGWLLEDDPGLERLRDQAVPGGVAAE